MRRQLVVAGLVAIALIGSLLWAQKIIDPQILAQQEEQRKRAEETGYADIEIDNLHREIAQLAPKAAPRMKKTDDGGLVLDIASGESIKTISERYIYNGIIVLYPTGDEKSPKLSKVKLVFERTNPFGKEYKREKREVVNPTPLFFDNPETPASQQGQKSEPKVDRNDDMILTYYESDFDERQQEFFREKEKVEIKTIPFYDKKMDFVEMYKKYLRRTAKALRYTVESIEISQKKRLRDLFELK
ncbi:MAG: hypothetical protein NZL89_05405 [Leptospiraceae bacterium]|nr:hypothetical protein [Leptospiraceae bacterium]